MRVVRTRAQIRAAMDAARPWVLIAGGILAIVVVVAIWRRSPASSLGPPESRPSPTVIAAVPVASLALPGDCRLFDKGYWETPIEAGVAKAIRLTAAPCAIAALDAIAQGGQGIEVTWTVPGLDGASPTVRAVLMWPYDATATGERNWTGTVTFPEPGQWVADPRLGGGAFFNVSARDAGLVQRSPNLPLPAAPQTVAILDGGATKVVRTFPAERGGTGMLRSPDRAVFVQARDGGRWLVTGDIATGALTPLFEVGAFTNITSAPDGRAIAVEWGRSNGRRELRIVTAAGKVTAIDDGTINPIVIEWAPDSNTLLAEGDSRWILGPDGAVRDRKPSSDLQGPQIAWAPDSRYALLWYRGQTSRVMRLDVVSLQEDAVLTGAELTGLAIAPSGQQIALAWQGGAVSVVPAEKLTGVTRDDFVVGSADRAGGSYSGIDGLSWSPDGGLLGFSSSKVAGGTGAPRGSAMRVIDVTTGVVRVVAEAPDFYAGQARLRAWSADSATLFALRYNCQGCEPSRSSIDVIDVAVGRIIDTFESSGYFGATVDGQSQLLSTPEGLLRTNGREPGKVLVPFPGGIFFGAPVVHLTAESGDPLLAVPVGVGRGQQIFAAQPDGSAVDLLAVLDLGAAPFALIDETALIVRGDRQWERRSLTGGVPVPYIASGGALEKFDLVLSPSKRLAVDLDREGFAVLDVTGPSLPAVVARRAYPGDVQGPAAWSTDERRLAFRGEHAIGIFDIESGAEHRFPLDALGAGLGRDETVWALTWAPSGALEFTTASALWRLDVATGTTTKVIDAPRPGGFTQGTFLAHSPDGRTLAAVTQFGTFALLAGGDWKQLSAVGVAVGGGVGVQLHWAPDSSAVAYAGASSNAPEGIIVAPLDGSGAYRLVAPGAE